MENNNGGMISEWKEKILQIYSDFLTRVEIFNELVIVGHRFLIGFHQGLEFLCRPPINKTSDLVEQIIRSNETKRVLSYVEAGCMNVHDSILNTSKLHTCQRGLQDYLHQAKDIVNKLECLVNEATSTMQAVNEGESQWSGKDAGVGLVLQVTNDDEEEMIHFDQQKREVIDYAVLMSILYSMVKQDYIMQESIVSALNLKMTSEELQSYCELWPLRPFIDDDLMDQALLIKGKI